jgi:hypothetical protein
MTQDEMEAEIKGLREQVSQLQQLQENQKKYWFRWGHIAAFIALAAAIVTIHDNIVIHHSSDVVFVVTVLCILFSSMALRFAGRPPAHLPFWSQLTWGWSGLLQARTSSNVR